MATYLVSMLNGLAMGALLFAIALGLSLVFGMMDVLNLAHGAVYLVGAYVAVALVADGGGALTFVAAVLLAAGAGAVLGTVLAGLSRATPRHLDQALLTLGVSLVVAEALSMAFGDDVHSITAPAPVAGGVTVLGQTYPLYRLLVIGFGVLLAVGVHVLVERSRLGSLIRATVADRGMVSALGVNTGRVLTGVFAAGAGLAAVGGVLAGPILGAAPGLDEKVLLLALVVVVVGGLGSVRGALLGAVLIGQVQALGTTLLPEYASFLIFGAMGLVLLLRPAGLLPARTAVHA
ncbi:branched-chain amino acid ABC transporter permease [Nonomuraea gerenzanensis]|uniref:High-affinity branched-chain amino acid transport system permease protein LivH (TC 3.A.1.4.1) n=1 Tax=Nonomuraea gerenzanensis TaxID=93944 RepID=A0A1M4E9X3_9ACTN|nr:branched-chain amino acid ABC transporter permease [Nonomuraea gerenzanensis]UBU17931.1 branched-chain amino acid ABC transporter permease [Nonomuraea gerenzanensis]SBO95727.1 High-affinity branched-chain amino acid transport system permease protein LivH (TC 3.A.1.4.1) [Nonomuraea gerenzanensis]